MKAAVIERPGTVKIREVPEAPLGDYDCWCSMLYGSTCSATDLHMIQGKLPFPIGYPTIFGHESIGRVTQVGEKVRYFKPGDLLTRVGAPALPDGSLNAHWGGFSSMGLARDHRAMREDGRPRAEWDAYRVNQVLPPDLTLARRA